MSTFDVIFAGGGLAAGLAATALRKRFPHLRMALVERGATLGGNHTWCFHEGDLDQEGHALLSPFVETRWERSEIALPGRTCALPFAYYALGSAKLDQVVRQAFRAEGDLLVLGTGVTRVQHDGVSLADGRSLRAPLVLDARGPTAQTIWEGTGFQKFLGLELELDAPSGRQVPLLMDGTLAQQDGFRFMYVLPYEPTRLLVEETFFSSRPELDEDASRAAILAYAARAGWRIKGILREERGLLPMPLWLDSAPPLASPLRLGLRGGWFHPTTAYSLPQAARVAICLAEGPLEEAPSRLQALWREHREQARFATFLNRLLFRAAAPERRVAIFARFFGLPPSSVARFFALRMTTWDRARILCGRPPAGMSFRDALFPQEVRA